MTMNYKNVYNPTRGVKSDFTKLLDKFSEKESVRYKDFAEVWKSMSFSYLSAGRAIDKESREFFEEVNPIGLEFYLPPYNFQVRVGGLYILYGIYVTQPCVPKVPIRVTFEQWIQILEFQKNVHSQKHLDVEYIFQKLFCEKAFLFVATPQEVYIKAKDRMRIEKTCDTEQALNDKLKEVANSASTVFTPEIIQQLQAIHAQYHRLKLGIAGPNADRPDRSLDVVEDSIVKNIDDDLEQHRRRLTSIREAQKTANSKRKKAQSDSYEDEDDTDEDDPDFDPNAKSKQASVKANAFRRSAKQTKGRRHRTVLTQDASASSPEKPVVKIVKKIKKKKGEDTSDDDVLMSPSTDDPSAEEEYVSMPTLDLGESVGHTIAENSTAVLSEKQQKQQPKIKKPSSPKSNTSSSKLKEEKSSNLDAESAHKVNEPETSRTDDSKLSQPAEPKTKKKGKGSKTKVSPVKKKETTLKGKRKKSVEVIHFEDSSKELNTEEPTQSQGKKQKTMKITKTLTPL